MPANAHKEFFSYLTAGIRPIIYQLQELLVEGRDTETFNQLLEAVTLRDLIQLLNEGRRYKNEGIGSEHFSIWCEDMQINADALKAIAEHHQREEAVNTAVDIYILATGDYSYLLEIILLNKLDEREYRKPDEKAVRPELVSAAKRILGWLLDALTENVKQKKLKARLKQRFQEVYVESRWNLRQPPLVAFNDAVMELKKAISEG